jgi:hypothetical protein
LRADLPSPPKGGFTQKAGTIAGTTDVAVNFAKFIGYRRYFGVACGRLKTGS